MRLKLSVNCELHVVDVDPNTPLLYVLRNDLGLNGPKFGCGQAQCGSCTVLVDQKPLRCCVVPASAAVGRELVTLEGIGTRDEPHPLQQAFIDEQAMQCGYCVNGILMGALAFLNENPNPSEPELRKTLASYLCRCGAHDRILRAIQKAAKEMSK